MIRRRTLRIAASLIIVGIVPALVAPVAFAEACDEPEPDSLQISWTEPCESGTWLLDTEVGCRMWDLHPDVEDRASWSGRCNGLFKEGFGLLQWFEHGRPADRFEGTFRNDRRIGVGHYRWTDADSYQGQYDADVPHGEGAARIDGETFAGIWQRGCLVAGDKVIAIGVPIADCPSATSPEALAVREGLASPPSPRR